MLNKDQLRGVWVSVPTEWDAAGNFDEKTFRDSTVMLIDAGVHGVYTTGSTGEYYALDWDEYTHMVDAFAAETVGKIGMQVGASWFNTRDVIQRVRYARDKGIEAVQVCFPFWMEMRQEDYDQFFVDIYKAVPDIAIIHYNVYRTKKVFGGQDYARILSRVPTLIGSKAGMSLSDFMYLTIFSPQMNHFTGESTLAAGMLLGAQGMYTSYALVNPKLMLDYYTLCATGRWEQAVAIARRLAYWETVAFEPLVEKGYWDPTIDKALTELGGWLPGNRRTRKPHSPLSDADMAELRATTERVLPEILGYRA